MENCYEHAGKNCYAYAKGVIGTLHQKSDYSYQDNEKNKKTRTLLEC